MARVSIQDIHDMKCRSEKIPMVTAYDYTSAQIAEAAGIPLVLVGDSLGMVTLGYENTIPVSMEEMLHHSQAVVRGTSRALVVLDLPFLSYQITVDEALRNAGRALQEGGVQAVKLEGGQRVAETVRQIVEVGIPVMGHIGLTPQSVYVFGGYRARGREKKEALELVRDAQALQEAGAFTVVLELIPAPLSRLITKHLDIATIGIGAGPHCDGQVQVFHDILGLFNDFIPKHTRRYAEGFETFKSALERFIEDVRSSAFPSESETFSVDESMIQEIEEALP
jgi:3-methyl-2-oxobutanoate hydroxymethyltransferase